MRPLQCWVTQPGMGKPDCHSEYCGVDPAGLREGGKPYLRRSLPASSPKVTANPEKIPVDSTVRGPECMSRASYQNQLLMLLRPMVMQADHASYQKHAA